MSSLQLLRNGCRGISLAHASPRTTADQAPSQASCILGRSTAIRRLIEQMERAIPHLRVAAIEGECGTGKSLVARELHQRGPASQGPLVSLHSSVFHSDQVQAGGGLLYLERIDEMPPNRQAMLLHFLRCSESFTFEATPTPLQIVVSSTRPLRALVAAGSLMPDLAYRLTAVRFYLPPLRERHEDLPILAHTFLDRFATKYGKPIQGLGAGALAQLFSHTWPGNVRELHSVLEAAFLEAEGQWIRPIDIVLTPPICAPLAAYSTSSGSTQTDLSLEAATRNHVATVMSFTGGNKKRAAELLRVSRSTLYRMLEDHP